jgi:hypothetical protein
MVLRRVLYAGEFGDIESLIGQIAPPRADPSLDMFGLVLQELAAHQRAHVQATQPGPGH